MPAEMPPFRGSWTASRDPASPRAQGTADSQGNSRKKAAKPLILKPPVVKGVDMKQSAHVKQLFRNEPDEYIEPLISEAEEHPESGEMKEEEASESVLMEESSDHFFFAEESSEQFDIGEESSEDFNSGEESSEDKETIDETEPLNRKSYEYPLIGPEKDQGDDQESSDETEAGNDLLKLIPAELPGRTKDIKVKLPVNLAHVDLEIDIFDTFNLSRPIASVTNVEWSIHSINMDVVLPTVNFFSKGILLLDIEYVECTDDDRMGTMHSLKLHVPWSKVLPVNWILKPELSNNNSKEYMFTETDGSDPTFHREFSEKLVDELDFQLTSLNCTWNEQLMDKNKILIQGTAILQIDIFQKQCVDLRELVSQK
jgi:hypothetical protein